MTETMTNVSIDTNKENVPPQDDSMAGILADVHGTAKDAMAAQLNGSAKSAVKRCPGLRRDDPEKIEKLYVKFGGFDQLLKLTANVGSFIESISSVSTNNATLNSCSMKLAIDALEYVVSEGKQHLSDMR